MVIYLICYSITMDYKLTLHSGISIIIVDIGCLVSSSSRSRTIAFISVPQICFIVKVLSSLKYYQRDSRYSYVSFVSVYKQFIRPLLIANKYFHTGII